MTGADDQETDRRNPVSTASKTFLAFVVLIGTAVAIAAVSVRELNRAVEELQSIKRGHLRLARAASQLETHEENRFRDLRRGLEARDPATQRVILRIASAYFPEVIERAANRAIALAQTEVAAANSEAQRTLFRGLGQHLTRIRDESRRVSELVDALYQRSLAGTALEGAPRALSGIESVIRGELYELQRSLDRATSAAILRSQERERHAIFRVIGLAGAGLLFGLIFSVWTARALAPIADLVHYARAISRGDYEQPSPNPSAPELRNLASELERMAEARREREQALDTQTIELESAYRRVEHLRRYHESVVRSLRTGVIVTDRELLVTSANPAGRHFLPEGVGAALPRTRLGAMLADSTGAPWATLADQSPRRAAAISLRPDQFVDVAVTPLHDETESVQGLVVTCEDVTENVQTKEALIRSERLAAIGRMSAHVTHELRNPLSSIGINAEMLMDTLKLRGADPSAQEMGQAIIREVERLTEITEQYLRFARLPEPVLAPVDLVEVVRDLGRFVEQECQAAQVSLRTELPAHRLEARVDGDQLRQALLNLVRNAREAMPSGGEVRLIVKASDTSVRILVEDEGPGISEEALERIFDPFFSTKLTGTGLGLALTQQIVSEHGGRLIAENHQSGARVILEFPLSAQAPSPERPA